MLKIDQTKMLGTHALVSVVETQEGDAFSLKGFVPQLKVEEKVAGFPSYTASYTPTETGTYTLATRQLTQGGLRGEYYDNQYFLHSPVISRIDPTINFNWGKGRITTYGRDYITARWWGKIVAPTTETYAIYLHADDGARIWVDHTLLIDTWDSTSVTEKKAYFNFTVGSFHDIRIDYKEERSNAMTILMWGSPSKSKEVIPSSALYYADHVVGSPRSVSIVPGAADFPNTFAYGPGLEAVTAGIPGLFTIQARDARGNNKTTGGYVFEVDVDGPSTQKNQCCSGIYRRRPICVFLDPPSVR
jgi:hypothetical protein